MITPPDLWETSQKILVILAHPDDPEFFCGATLYRWASGGNEIHYCLLTCGDKGGSFDTNPPEICAARREEQEKAASVIGVKSVQFLDYEDGYLVPTMDLRKDIVRVLRKQRPDILVACDPTNLYPSAGYGLNHPDHRAAGQVVLDAVFPASGNAHYFPDLLEEGLLPFTPREVWLSLPSEPTVVFDVTEYWEVKIKALLEHHSQVGDREAFLRRMKSRHTPDSTEERPRYEEGFRLLTLRRV